MSHACAMSASPSPLLAPEPCVSRVESVWLTALSPAPSTTWHPVGSGPKRSCVVGEGFQTQAESSCSMAVFKAFKTQPFLQGGHVRSFLRQRAGPDGLYRAPSHPKPQAIRYRRLKGQERQEPDPLGAESGCLKKKKKCSFLALSPIWVCVGTG